MKICNAAISIPKEITPENNISESSSSTCNSPLQDTTNKENFEEILTRDTPRIESPDIAFIETNECNNNNEDKPRILVQEEGK